MHNCYFPTKDTTITNVTIDSTSKSGSNSGQSEILETFVLTSSLASVGKSRVLMHFDLSELSASTVDGSIPTSSVEFRLVLKNAPHGERLPSSFDMVVYPLSASWDEGSGLANYDEDLKDSGYANWTNATLASPWGSPGADFITTISASQHFDAGSEDLNVDISNIVYAFLTGGMENRGILIKYPDYYETGSTDFYTKKFFSRHVHRPDRKPKIQAFWESNIRDDRKNIYYNMSGVVYYYRMINGIAQSVNGDVYVDVFDSGSNVVQTLTSSLKESGIYEASGVLLTSSPGTQIYRDVWFTSQEQLFTGNIIPSFSTGSSYFDYSDIDINLTNIKNQYLSDEKATIKAYCTRKNYQPAIVRSGTLTTSPILLRDAYYQISNFNNEEILVDFSTGSIKYSKLSYDQNGNYFNIWTKSLVPGNVYRVKILVNYNNQKIIFDKGWNIKVV